MKNNGVQRENGLRTLAIFERKIKCLTDSQLEKLEIRLVQCGKILEKGRALICNHRAARLWED